LLQRIVARKIGVPDNQPVPGPIAAILDEQLLTTALEQIRQADARIPAIAEGVGRTRSERNLRPERPQPKQIVEDLLERAFLPGFDLLNARTH